ncbi:HAD family hydrolase [Paenibacillus tarimensis]
MAFIIGAKKYISETYGFDKVVCFGDNLNDLSMFEAADEGYAVSNEHDRVKKAATQIIGSNNNDGVARFLKKRWGR